MYLDCKSLIVYSTPYTAATPPTNLWAVQERPTGIHVLWTPPTPLGYTTGYRIYYRGGSNGSVDVSGGSTDYYTLTGLQNGANYIISIVGTSEHFFSAEVEVTVSLGEKDSPLSLQSSFLYMCVCATAVPGQPSVTVSSTTAITISLSWSVPGGSVEDSYEVMWERDTLGECGDEDEGSTTITDGSASYTITGLEEDSSYAIAVTATNAAGSAVSDPVTGITGEAGEGLNNVV